MLALLLALAAAAEPAPVKTASATAPVAVLIRPIARGEIVERADLEIEPRPAVGASSALPVGAIAGREATRNLMAGAAVRAADVVAPRLVRRGEPVTIAWRAGGLVITAAGKALSSGAKGDPIRVVAGPTSRTLDATVEGAGAVRIAVR